MRFGPGGMDLAWLVEAAGGVLPPGTPPPPALSPLLDDAWEAFWQLNSARAHGMSGPLPLSMSDIIAYHAALGRRPLEDLIVLLQHADAAWFELVAERMEKQHGR